MPFIVVYITTPNVQEANKIADHLLAKRLIACANIHPIQSAYHWQGAVVREDEFVALVKTRMEYWERVKAAVLEIHSYQTPCIMRFEVTANADYEQWIMDETQNAED